VLGRGGGVSLFVKICGLRDADTVAAAVAAGADAIGFVFAKSPRQVSVDEAKEATSGVPKNVQRVAVMRHPSRDEWTRVRDSFSPDVLQTDAEDFANLDVPSHIVAWPVIREGAQVKTQSLPPVFVYEGPVSGSGATVNWAQAARLAPGSRMILAGGLDASNVGDAVREARPWGVDVSSGVESAPGIKDTEKIRQFIKAVRAAEIEA
jgi:phosphoribosylanthranilate isomerase